MSKAILNIYLKRANLIIKNSIKSAVFIDEKALEFYRPISSHATLEPEEQLSIELYKKFRDIGISITVHKFQPSDISSESTKRYLFEDRDLVLLDWKLDGNSGESYCLELLSDIVLRQHIHFCTIYTSETNNDEIINNLISYFSGRTKAYYDNLKETFQDKYDNYDEFKRVLGRASIDDNNLDENKNLCKELAKVDQTVPQSISQHTEGAKTGLKEIRIAFENWQKSEIERVKVDSIDRESSTIFINNTIITILNKSASKPNVLFKKLSRQIANSDNSFTKLLGIEMHNSISKSASFIDHNLLNVSKDMLLYHRKQLNNSGDEIPFSEFVKNILLEQTRINLRSEELKLLEPTFLDSITNERFKPTNSETALVNTFYNGIVIKSDRRTVNFGDIFKFKDEYFLCITALCDCHLINGQSNTKFKYFFVRGSSIPVIKGIELGDGGFISFLGENTCISWTGGGKNAMYVKPIQLFIPNPTIENHLLKANDWDVINSGVKKMELEYVFTLRQQYAQRIANHAFAHPIRVGVDFVKRK